MKEANASIQPADLQLARMIGWAVRSTANYTPWGSVCLPQAVAAKWMLKRRSISGNIISGCDEGRNQTGKTGGACLEYDAARLILTGAKGHRQYTVVSTFS